MLKKPAKIVKLLSSTTMILGLLLSVSITNANAVITINGDYTAALHIKARARLNATSLGIGYPGHTWRSDCAALNGDAVEFPPPNAGRTTNVWLSARDLTTNVKGYSSAAYMFNFPPGAGDKTIRFTDPQYPQIYADTCTPDNWTDWKHYA
ncbi:MAG: hypothetical protein LBI63_05145 [Candidatus Ancillula sp.]|jgi:hypothetical protein|nr:hypothetical protein [Candidatus Ancillula sp.]